MSQSLLGVEGLSFHCTKNVRVKSCTLTKTIRNKRTKQNKKLKRLDKRLSLLPCTLMCVNLGNLTTFMQCCRNRILDKRVIKTGW